MKSVTDLQRRTARDLAQRAQQSAILGDRTAARDQMTQAAALDPSNPDLAYQLARAQESAGAPDDAATEFCRFLALAPNAPEAAEARERVA
ncbi:MAG: tetratricopeptide repeat protein, partial [Gemmatimonadaceae bacterium]